MSRSVRVVKVGGSLLDFESLPDRLLQWLQRQTPAAQVLVAGGGQLADVIRQADAVHRIGDELGHWLCVSLMGVTARLLARLVPESQLIEDYDELVDRLATESPRIVFAVESFLRQQEPVLPGAKASRDWRTTSDAIAARLAHSIRADELVLLKSTALPRGISRREAAKKGLIDERFPAVAETLSVRWVNLRAPDHAEATL